SYTARVVDAGGNQGAASAAFTLSVDTSAPSQSATISVVTDDVTTGTGALASGATTHDDTTVLSGTPAAALGSGEYVQVLRGGTVVGTATVAGTGWSYADSGLADGQSYEYTVRVVDAAGTPGIESDGFTLSVSTVAPPQAVTI